MINKMVKVLTKISAAFICLLFVANFLTGCSFGKTNAGYSISGYVFDELGAPVANVTISSELGEVTTDKDGKYTISNIKESILVKPSISGYHFKETSKKISKKTDDANFVAYQEYVAFGVVDNNGLAVQNARIEITSLSGNFQTTTDENGRFQAAGVAGEAILDCTVLGEKYYSAKTTIENPSVQINSTSNFTLDLKFDDKNVDYSKITLKIDEDPVRLFEATTTFKTMKYGMKVELESDYYSFSKNSFEITELDQITKVDVFKRYSVFGVVKSGETPLANANVYLDENRVTSTDHLGRFNIGDVIKNRAVSVSYENFVFEVVSVSHESTEANFDGTKTVTLNLDTDYLIDDAFEFGETNFVKIDNNTYKFVGVKLGQQINASSDDYYIENSVLTVEDADYYTKKAYAFYNASVQLDRAEEYHTVLDGSVVESSALNGLFGKHTVSASYSNYVFTTANVSYSHKTATLDYAIPYNVAITVTSADVPLVSSYAVASGQTISANSEAQILIENLTGTNDIVVACDKFNSQTISVSGETTTEINLSYDITGIVKTGNIPVVMATISVAGKTIQTNEYGKFSLSGLKGQQTLETSKENNIFENVNVFGSQEYEVQGTYSIKGVLSGEFGPIENQTIELRKISDVSNILKTTTDSEGKYAFVGLNDKYYLLTYDATNNVVLKPDFYTVTSGGSYDFNMSGFKVSGYVKTGDIPIANAHVVAGSESTYTNAEGYYVFELLTSACEVSVQKQGYTFSSNIAVDDDADDVNFTATYSVSGVVSLSGRAVEGVNVLVNGESTSVKTGADGSFTLLSLSGENIISFEKEGYVFDNSSTVNSHDMIEISCRAQKLISVMSGDIPVSVFDVYINGEFNKTSTSNIIEIVVDFGDVITFTKQGYTIESVIIGEARTYETNASYTVSGRVVSGIRNLANVLISIGTTKVTTNSQGEFEISGLVGKNEIQFEKTGFNKFGKEVSAHTSTLSIDLTYNISGNVYVGTKAISGAVVTIGSLSATTDSDGKFEISGVSGEFNISCEKEGYTFDTQENLFGTQKITFMAKYNISGYVKTGNIAISQVELTLSVENSDELKYAITDSNGYFEFTGILGTASIVAKKDGYNQQEISGFVDASTNVEFNLSYSYTVNFGITNVNVYLNGKLYTNSGAFDYVVVSNLKGENTLRFEKVDTTFTPSSITVKSPKTENISYAVAYDISGRVTVVDGSGNVLVGASNVKVKAGVKETTTDHNGYYTLEDVSSILYVSDSALNPNGETEGKSIQSSGTYNLSISNYNFGYFLYENGYRKLNNNPTGFAIVGSGTVSPSMGGNQSVYSISKKDSSGNRIKQNLNYGSEILGVDPKVSLLAYYDASADQWYYEQTKSVSSNMTASHSKSNLISNPVSISSYQSKYGASPDAFHPYSFTSSSGINSISNITESNGEYTFRITLSTNSSVYSMYKQQMNALSNQEVKSFEYIYLNFTVDKDGWITKLYIDEKYVVELMSVNITSKINYFFTKGNESIDAINLNNINASVKQNSLAGLYSAKKYDIITQVIYGF